MFGGKIGGMNPAICPQCQEAFDVPNTGRPKKFCSGKCRVANHRRAKRAKADLLVPDELAVKARWVRWQNTRRGERMTKRPVTVEGRAASVTDPGTWSPLEKARKSAVGDGLGFVLGQGVGCIDLDDVFDERGVLHPAARWLLRQLPETWVEVSPSGRGLHVWGLIPEAPGRVVKHAGISVEVYSRDRYLTVTGVPYEGEGNPCLKLADLSDALGFIL